MKIDPAAFCLDRGEFRAWFRGWWQARLAGAETEAATAAGWEGVAVERRTLAEAADTVRMVDGSRR